MSRLTIVLGLMAAVCVGCTPRDSMDKGFIVQAVKEGLTLEMSVPERHYVSGQTIPLTIMARNETRDDMVIDAGSGALVAVTVWRRTELGWEKVKRLPETAVMMPSPWKLPAKGSHTFTMNLSVTPDWPTGEWLKLTGELNGKPGVTPAGLVEIHATQEECNKAKVY